MFTQLISYWPISSMYIIYYTLLVRWSRVLELWLPRPEADCVPVSAVGHYLSPASVQLQPLVRPQPTTIYITHAATLPLRSRSSALDTATLLCFLCPKYGLYCDCMQYLLYQLHIMWQEVEFRLISSTESSKHSQTTWHLLIKSSLFCSF